VNTHTNSFDNATLGNQKEHDCSKYQHVYTQDITNIGNYTLPRATKY